MPEELTVGGRRLHELRYGENPHQRGALYAVPGPAGRHGARQTSSRVRRCPSRTGSTSTQRGRSSPSSRSRRRASSSTPTPAASRSARTLSTAYRRAYECDPRSAYGGIVGINRPIDLATAQALTETFLEAVVCPGIDDDAAAHLATKPRIRVLVVERPSLAEALDVRSIDGGLLVQTRDRVLTDRASMTVVSVRQPEEAEWRDLLIAWRVVRHVKSNAVVIVRDGMAVGVGAGQMSRVESSELAVARAGDRARGADLSVGRVLPGAGRPRGPRKRRGAIRDPSGWQQERPRGHAGRRCARDGGRARRGAPLPALKPPVAPLSRRRERRRDVPQSGLD